MCLLTVKWFKLLSKDIRARSSTPAGMDVDNEVLSYISVAKSYVRHKAWHSGTSHQDFYHWHHLHKTY